MGSVHELTPSSRPGAPRPTSPSSAPDRAAVGTTPPNERHDPRRFHLGSWRVQSAAVRQAPGWHPASVEALARQLQQGRRFPCCLQEADGNLRVEPLAATLERAVQTMQAAGAGGAIVQRAFPSLIEAFAAAGREASPGTTLRQLSRSAFTRFEESLDLSEAARESLAAELDTLRAELPSSMELCLLGNDALLRFYARAVLARRTAAGNEFRSDVEQLVARLDALLKADASHAEDAQAPAALAESLGAASGRIDVAALSHKLPSHRGSTRMSAALRNRVEEALSTLRSHLSGGMPQGLVVVHSGLWPWQLELDGVDVAEAVDPLTAATRRFEANLSALLEVFRARRFAKLLTGGRYDPDLHDDALSDFEGEALDESEMQQLPLVAVLESAGAFMQRPACTLSKLLAQRQPLHLLLLQEAPGFAEQDGGGTAAGDGLGPAQLAVAHREAFVLQSSLTEPMHLVEGFQRAAACLRPCVMAVTATDGHGETDPELLLSVAHASRSAACFTYDPDAGPSMGDRFALEANPQSDRLFPHYALEASGEEEEAAPTELTLTFADAAALSPHHHDAFWLLPPEHASSHELIDLPAYLALDEATSLTRIPFLWARTGEGSWRRAVMTREMAFACRNRMGAFRQLQEWAGIGDEYARRAAERARAEALEEARQARQAQEASHRAALEDVRANTASEAMDRLVAALLELDVTTVATVPRPLTRPPEPQVTRTSHGDSAVAPAPSETVVATEAQAEAEDDVDEAYIDSELCTSCNECVNLNPRLFKYNADQQAFVADAAAGSFAQLVQAAEKCPARCIHPGAPRSGDTSADAALVARAAPFN